MSNTQLICTRAGNTLPRTVPIPLESTMQIEAVSTHPARTGYVQAGLILAVTVDQSTRPNASLDDLVCLSTPTAQGISAIYQPFKKTEPRVEKPTIFLDVHF